MKKIILTFALIGFFAITLGLTKVSAATPGNQCHQIAVNKDKAVENMAGALQWSGDSINPCTTLPGTVNIYYDLDGGVTHMRRVYGNGDVAGYLGMTKYLACNDGRAKVMQRIYGPIPSRGIAWGFYLSFPFDDDLSTWIPEKEVCNTL